MKNLKNNNGIFYVVISLVAVLGIAGLVRAYSNIQTQNINVEGNYINNEAEGQVEEVSFGATPSPEHYQTNYFYDGIITGGAVISTSSDIAAITLTKTELNEKLDTLIWTPALDTTVTTPTDIQLVNLLGLQEIGSTKTIFIKNASSTATASITIAAGAGVDLQQNEDNADLAILGLDYAEITFKRTNAVGSTTAFMTEYTEAD